MKKILFSMFIVILMFCVIGCSSDDIKESDTFKKLSDVTMPSKKYDVNNMGSSEVETLNNFCFETSKYIINNNSIYSSVSLYMALSMLAEGSNGNTYEEIKNVMGFSDLNSLRSINKNLFENNFYENNKGKMRLANSFWVNLDLDVKEEYSITLKDYYYASGYKSLFNDETQENMCKWINNNTFDLLKVTKDDFSIKDLSLILMNTVYFDNKWQEEFKKSDTYTDTFYSKNGEIEVDFMHHSVENSYYETTKFTAACDCFENNNKITYILPNEGYEIDDITNDEDLKLLMNNKLEGNFCEINFSVPKFTCKNTLDLKEMALLKMGVTNTFTANANFSKISDTPTYVDYIKQIAGIELSEEGVKAAAVTIVGDCTSVGPGEIINFKINKPFLYYITDASGVVLFIGSMNNI